MRASKEGGEFIVKDLEGRKEPVRYDEFTQSAAEKCAAFFFVSR